MWFYDNQALIFPPMNERAEKDLAPNRVAGVIASQLAYQVLSICLKITFILFL